jgi:hypothetical protein
LNGVGRFEEYGNTALQLVVERINMVLSDGIECGFIVRPAHVARCLDAHWSLYSCNNI